MDSIRRFIYFSLSLILLVVCLNFTPAKAQTETTTPDFAAIDAFVEEQMKAHGIRGAAIAIVQGDRIAHMRGFGVAGPSGTAVTPQTPFFAGSVSKPVTALAVMQLVETGQIDLDAPVQRYLPWFETGDGQHAKQVTVRHLMNQTSGFGNAQGASYLAGDGQGTTEETVRHYLAYGLPVPLGTFEYSNLNFMTLGLIIEAVTNQPYGDYLEAYLFAPLAMENSFSYVGDAASAGMARGHYLIAGVNVPARTPNYKNDQGGGSLISSAEDLGHFLIANLDQGKFNGRSLLSPATIEQMHQVAEEVPYYLGFYNGFGDYNVEIEGLAVRSHGGDLMGYHADIILLPEEGWGVVVLENNNGLWTRPTPAYGAIAWGITNQLLGNEPVTGMSVRLISIIGAVVMLLLTALMVRSFVRLRLWRRRLEERPSGLWPAFRIIILPILGDLILPAAALFFTAGSPFPRKIDAWLTLGQFQPDLIYWLLFVAIALFVKAIIRLSIVLVTLLKSEALVDTATVAHGH